jgi:hypothetical protein
LLSHQGKHAVLCQKLQLDYLVWSLPVRWSTFCCHDSQQSMRCTQHVGSIAPSAIQLRCRPAGIWLNMDMKEKKKKRKTTQAAKHSLHQSRKRRHIALSLTHQRKKKTHQEPVLGQACNPPDLH